MVCSNEGSCKGNNIKKNVTVFKYHYVQIKIVTEIIRSIIIDNWNCYLILIDFFYCYNIFNPAMKFFFELLPIWIPSS